MFEIDKGGVRKYLMMFIMVGVGDNKIIMDVRGDREGIEEGVGRVEGEIGSREGERRLAVEEWEMLTRENMSLREQLSDYMYDMKKLKQKVFELEELI